jgi:tRNA A37 N6-isopentenylltransferase MiaA
MTKQGRMQEIESRIKREKSEELQSKQKYNQMLIKQNQEKTKEMKNDLQRQIRTKEMFEKTKKELEELKRERIIQHENALKDERNFIEKHVQDLDEEINEKNNRKQQELNNWNLKMDNLINDEDR